MRFEKLAFISLIFISLSFAGAGNIGEVLGQLCNDVKGFLGVAMVLMVLLAAVVYAVGQMLGAETRARATVWATAMFTGAIMAAVIYVITPWIISVIAPESGVSADGSCPGVSSSSASSTARPGSHDLAASSLTLPGTGGRDPR